MAKSMSEKILEAIAAKFEIWSLDKIPPRSEAPMEKGEFKHLVMFDKKITKSIRRCNEELSLLIECGFLRLVSVNQYHERLLCNLHEISKCLEIGNAVDEEEVGRAIHEEEVSVEA